MTAHAASLVFLRVGAWCLVAGLVGVLVWAGFDLVLIRRGELAGNSISLAAMRALYGAHPGVLIAIALVVGILIGVLLGHFGWAQVREVTR